MVSRQVIETAILYNRWRLVVRPTDYFCCLDALRHQPRDSVMVGHLQAFSGFVAHEPRISNPAPEFSTWS